MAQIESTVYQKIKEARRLHPEITKQGILYSFRLKFTIFIISIALCSLFFSYHIEKKYNEIPEYSLSPGYIWYGPTIKAEYTFPIEKSPEIYRKEIDEAATATLPIFIYNENALDESLKRLSRFIDLVKTSEKLDDENLIESFSESAIQQLKDLSQSQRETECIKIESELKRILIKSYKKGIINLTTASLESEIISIRIKASDEFLLQKVNLGDSMTIFEHTKEFIIKRTGKAFHQFVNELLPKIIIPNLKYSEELTNKARELAIKSVAKTAGLVRKGDVIIEKGERVSDEHLLKLTSYENTRLLKKKNIFSIWNTLGSIGHVLIIFLILFLYLFFIRKRIFWDNVQFGILCLILILVAFQSWLSIQIPTKIPIEYIMLFPAFSMLAAIVFDSRTTFYTTVTMALLVAGIRGNDYETSTTMLVAGTLAAYSVRDIQSRTQMFQSILFILIGFFIAITAFALERSTELESVIYRVLLSSLNSIISPLLTFGLVFILDRFTNITTDLRIKEFDNLSHPLLVKLSENAPGTYQHTISVAMLAERCARAIKANPLLTKVGTYFHDIGKMNKPEYFVENQIDRESKHDLISPKKSAEIIREHVINGIELATQYKLPQRIIDFIPMHHGTTLIKHFYAKALENKKPNDIVESDFRYPGPKPKSKETAILMICDPAEALSRLHSNNQNELEKAIEKIVEERVIDGQFDECDITFKELEIIKETCAKSLMGISHQRIIYKEIPKESD